MEDETIGMGTQSEERALFLRMYELMRAAYYAQVLPDDVRAGWLEIGVDAERLYRRLQGWA